MLSLEKQNQLREQYRQIRPQWQPATEVYAQLVKDYVKPESMVLDLGCGRGGLVEQLEHPLAQVVGVDPDWQSLVEHRLPLPRTVGVSGRLPFAAATFDVIFASWLLEHLAHPAVDLAEISRVLKPDGVFVFVTPNKRHPLSMLNRLFGRFAVLQGRLVEWLYGRAADDAFPTWYRANTTAALQTLGMESGLQLTHLYTIPDPTYIAFTPLLFRLMCWFETWLRPARRLHLVGILKKTNGEKTTQKWIYNPKKKSMTVPESEKQEIKLKADQLVENFLKPQYVQERDDEAQFNHIVDIHTKWWRNYLYFNSIYYCPGPNALTSEFESKFARLEYVDKERFNLSFMRYTEQWVEIYTDLTLEQCLESIKNDPFFHP